jgi:hypothetical protein
MMRVVFFACFDVALGVFLSQGLYFLMEKVAFTFGEREILGNICYICWIFHVFIQNLSLIMYLTDGNLY